MPTYQEQIESNKQKIELLNNEINTIKQRMNGELLTKIKNIFDYTWELKGELTNCSYGTPDHIVLDNIDAYNFVAKEIGMCTGDRRIGRILFDGAMLAQLGSSSSTTHLEDNIYIVLSKKEPIIKIYSYSTNSELIRFIKKYKIKLSMDYFDKVISRLELAKNQWIKMCQQFE